jgi:hypothetical protein
MLAPAAFQWLHDLTKSSNRTLPERQGASMTSTQPITERPAWKNLQAHYQKVRELHLRKLFADDPRRGEQMTLETAGIYLDYSKNRITAETLRLLLDLADAANLRARVDAMFRGEKINVSEQRAVLHVALRAPREASILVEGENVVPAVHAVLDRMADFSAASAVAIGRVLRENESAMSSTSVSAVRTSDR